jgi:hypothetical protein
MPNTSHGLPYPVPTDPVAAGADAIKALATALDPLVVVHGSTTITTNANGIGVIRPPVGGMVGGVVVVAETAAGTPALIAWPTSDRTATPDYVQIKCQWASGALFVGGVTVHWIAWRQVGTSRPAPEPAPPLDEEPAPRDGDGAP